MSLPPSPSSPFESATAPAGPDPELPTLPLVADPATLPTVRALQSPPVRPAPAGDSGLEIAKFLVEDGILTEELIKVLADQLGFSRNRNLPDFLDGGVGAGAAAVAPGVPALRRRSVGAAENHG
ncbi:MAG: hypothetical protein LM523_03165 [Candidatus Contendobacter sp.]|nr:hypothetical protein [Candidatus Contendobacter sp.]